MKLATHQNSLQGILNFIFRNGRNIFLKKKTSILRFQGRSKQRCSGRDSTAFVNLVGKTGIMSERGLSVNGLEIVGKLVKNNRYGW